MPSNGRGFGAPRAAAAPPRSAPSGGKLVRIFRFGVNAAAVNRAVESCGWQGRVELVDSIKTASLILAVKNTSGGKHQNLAQGEKAASNAGIPFVVVGRKMSAENFKKALLPHVEPHSAAAAAAAREAAAEAANAAANKAAADAFFQSAATWSRLSR